ncbi:PKD domain-containing protein [Sulfidibacter corallicola]|uniref:PKD domain-containing protein n=1 Tax=Sulfidibacter corallicola TaxID=2818388 RepID=A0A8A4TID0_SULCO|nr:PKD domain-containing protein [Sulfidibacter corallicola]QTD48538.1 PKD domain-containing protein [Sulfidibacter corallicola]
MKNASIFWCLLVAYVAGYAAQFDPGPGKTRVLVGQTFQSEYSGYLNGTGLTPQGSSHYATFYLGVIEQGDDNPNAAFLDWVIQNGHGDHALVALSFKDNTAAGGYGQMVDDNGAGFNPDAIWEAMSDINSGQWDAQIDDFADLMKARPNTKFFLRIGYEVSLMLFAYRGQQFVVDWVNQMANSGINVFENPDAIAELDRQAYIDAYNYVANRLRNVNGVGNVDFVYHPVRGFNDTRWLYPGDSFVDWVAFSVFNNDICLEVNGTFNCQGQDVDPNLAQAIQFAQGRGKPLMVAEAAVQAPFSDTESGFIEYLDKLDNFIDTYDVRVLAYINSNWPAHGWGPEWGDSRVEVRGGVLNHWLNNYGENSRYLHGGSGPPVTDTELHNGVTVENLSANQGETLDFYIDIPAGATNFVVAMSGGSGDADLYTRFDQKPTTDTYACRPYASGNQETCTEPNPSAGRWYVSLRAYRSFSGVRLVASFDGGSSNTPPVAEANGPYGGQVGNAIAFSSAGSNDPDGNITSYQWNFGDGNTGSGANPSHVYSAEGTYTVTLTVTDNQNASASDTATVTVTGTGGPLALQNGVPVSGLAAGQGDWLQYYIDLPGDASDFQVSISGGSGDADLYTRFQQEPTTGSYDCRPYLNGNNETCSVSSPNSGRWYVFIRAYRSFSGVSLVASFTTSGGNQPPVAQANGPYQGQPGQGISFSSNGSNDPDGTIASYQWNFGDGQGSSSANPSHAYASAGTYTVTLKVTDNQGATSSDQTTATVSTSPGTGTYLAPVDGRTLMILGQDLLSVSQYANASGTPTPGGITTYVAFYEILNDSGANGVVNGALGFNTQDQPNNVDVDWGGGPLNAYNAAVGWPQSTLQIGLNIAEGNNGNIWCGGCLNQLANGQRQAEIDQLADFFQAIPNVAVYLRIGYEFDGLWNNGYENRSVYIAAYRRIVDGLRARGVNNVAYVWQSSASPIDDVIEGTFENIGDWYPGDDYVDWVGMSWFLLPEELPPVGGSPATQRQLADDVLDFARSHQKAVMIAESTAQGYDINVLTNRNISPVWDGQAGGNQQNLSAGGLWNAWFVPLFDYIHDNRDVIKAVSYINADWDSQGSWGPPYPEGYWGDTRVEANSVILNNWIDELSDSSVWLNGSPTINQDVGLQ